MVTHVTTAIFEIGGLPYILSLRQEAALVGLRRVGAEL